MIKIDWEELCEAMGDYTQSRYYFLNKLTGEIIILSEYMSEEGKRELRKKIDVKHINDYALIPTITSREGYKIMEEFISIVYNDKLKHQLEEALNKEAPFKRFKEIVFKHPEERKHWLDFRKEKLTQKATNWFKKIGILEFNS
ncbi:hypothetical protein KAW65_04190 [candidate division WOR-3 bacterium]|nr:hypothetical protein [candidate division WOR-3 bacterium]